MKINAAIFIQKDNVRPHISTFHQEFLQHVTSDEFDFHLFCQFPNSPSVILLIWDVSINFSNDKIIEFF